MEHLVKEGFKDAVGVFQEESGIDPGVNMSMLDDQIRIRDAVEAGNGADRRVWKWNHTFLTNVRVYPGGGGAGE